MWCDRFAGISTAILLTTTAIEHSAKWMERKKNNNNNFIYILFDFFVFPFSVELYIYICFSCSLQILIPEKEKVKLVSTEKRKADDIEQIKDLKKVNWRASKGRNACEWVYSVECKGMHVCELCRRWCDDRCCLNENGGATSSQPKWLHHDRDDYILYVRAFSTTTTTWTQHDDDCLMFLKQT